ncbi:MAG: tetratricopeptide repeat protein, partial [Sphingomicrobium sp.]
RATIFYRARRFPEAIAYARQALAMVPQRPRLLGILALAAFMTGDYAEARRGIEQLPADDMRRLTGSAFLAAHDGNRAAAERFRQDTVRRFGDAAHYQYAQIDAQLGDKDRAIAELELAWTERDAGLASILVDPFLDPLRKDPRFAAIVAKLNFP